MLKFIRGIASCQMGATAVEYGLILSLLVVAIMAALSNVAGSTTDMWNDVSNDITEASN
ncbi:MAG: Flp family type IVb pilin [Sphingomonadales bacterium]|jgi:pilus assembly protein Flp/PilA|nr:Flp family type IVb pilin [Sphingomonadales bacterium]MBK9004298.1 Flp family type IVb pilin [Sphingomonadales bacterium]MBK9269474.1 Flp family type IVb pilin [Sphingomonadales bacterium]MBP6433931.1 Flp family type IVb pilin [Sphingorhabdus sp.]